MTLLLHRFGFYLAAFWTAITLNFFIPRWMPGDPANTLFMSLRGRVNPDTIAAIKKTYGFDGSLWDQYLSYLGRLAQGDFGVSSINYPEPAASMLFYAAGWTLVLVGIATVLTVLVGILFGIYSAWNRGGFIDSFFTPFNVILYSFSPAVVALLLFYSFSLEWELFPLGRAHNLNYEPEFSWSFIRNVLYHASMPVLSIFLVSIGSWHLGMRNTMINLLNEDYITLARAKGLSNSRIMYRYAARNAVLPNLTAFALAIGYLFGGSLVTEVVYNYPGLGKFTLSAIQQRDYTFIQGQLLLLTIAILLSNILADIANFFLDPRLRFSAAQ